MALDISDLGFDADAPATPTTATPVETGPKPLSPGSTVAQALFAVWDGCPVTVVNSPPGAGKSTLIAEVIDQLFARTELTIMVATPTRNSAFDLSGRIAEVIGLPEKGEIGDVRLSINKMDPPPGVSGHGTTKFKRMVDVRTIASASMASAAGEVDLLIIDEAYQATFADVAAAARGAAQILLVGDPGQIGPVVTSNTTPWAHLKAAPHHRAPEVFLQREDATVLTLDATYRLGKAGAEAIAPLYDFDFESKRPDRHIEAGGVVLPEIHAVEIDVRQSPYAIDTLRTVADLADDMVRNTFVTFDEEGNEVKTALRQRDVCVVVAHKAQESAIAAILDERQLGGITVGTADSLQGGQWPAVIGLDAMVGYSVASGHHASVGRLCVMASRHMAHLTWVHDGQWEQGFRAAEEELSQKEILSSIHTRLKLCAITADPDSIHPVS